MLLTLTALFDRLMRRYTPDPFLFALFLTFIVLGLGFCVTGHSLFEMATFWGDGFWTLIPFTLQMVMILVTGYTVATSQPVTRLLKRLAERAKTPGQAVVITTLVACVGCWLNWGFGLVVGAFTCRAMASAVPTVNYRALVASAYSGFLVWHGGLSGSIPLLLATPGNFSEHLVGRDIPLSETLWMPLNLAAIFGLLILLPLTNLLMSRHKEDPLYKAVPPEEEDRVKFHPQTPAEHLENAWVISFLTALLGIIYLVVSVRTRTFNLDINALNFIFLIIGIVLHGRPRKFLRATSEAAKKISPILVQYPFYAGIMAIMIKTGLAELISQKFVNVSNEVTFPLFTFYSAGLVNFFVPSGGGQWAVQSPIVIPATIDVGTDMCKSIMAVAWGDAWTNMAQPFWALPLLAVAGLKVRDIMGYCVTILIVSGIFLSLLFLVF